MDRHEEFKKHNIVMDSAPIHNHLDIRNVVKDVDMTVFVF